VEFAKRFREKRAATFWRKIEVPNKTEFPETQSEEAEEVELRGGSVQQSPQEKRGDRFQ
jgi:CRISPR/Cas system-associated protein Cas5 (RAMP superfamily)